MLGKWLSPMHPHYPSPALYLLLHSLSLGGGGVLHQPQVSPAPPSASLRTRSGPARPTVARISNHVWKEFPAWLFTAFSCFLVSAQNAARALNPGSYPLVLNNAGG